MLSVTSKRDAASPILESTSDPIADYEPAGIAAGPVHTGRQNTQFWLVVVPVRFASVVVVVEAAGDYGDHVGLDVVHEPVLLGYPA